MRNDPSIEEGLAVVPTREEIERVTSGNWSFRLPFWFRDQLERCKIILQLGDDDWVAWRPIVSWCDDPKMHCNFVLQVSRHMKLYRYYLLIEDMVMVVKLRRPIQAKPQDLIRLDVPKSLFEEPTSYQG